MSRQLPFLASTAPVAFAHRGFSKDGLENSLAAFRAAVALGFDYLETDVHTTADGVLLVFHDARLEQITDGTGRISALTAERVAQARISGRETIPTFAELVSALPGVRLNLDVKDRGSVQTLAAAIEESGLHDRVCVASFSDRRRRAVLKRLSRPTASSAGVVSLAAFICLGPWLPKPLLRRILHDVDCLQVPVRYRSIHLVTPKSVTRAHELGLKVHVWTIDDPRRMHALFDLGVDGLMTDRADLLAEVMRERGYWPRPGPGAPGSGDRAG
ncbi:glycerophosphodiester phosphodiesterase [Paenarthrobacter sp. PH39-S1]|uniref:glycerophosphodiester phosphodiesterase n=1 Tax=Paenarthrobacter sp. PH39-S1 TaxID=3046204 RepID=UPI0024B9DA0C|nr:glycerophosphodiester phosphodiesterase [Paenarthrobacter sp. PH39-S1]MDJ0357648.1 glycerophosphodiester phosphodiesterase [Paenarthrobacter sp. PH39-S1]